MGGRLSMYTDSLYENRVETVIIEDNQLKLL